MPYHIDEANSNLTFEVVGNKLIITAPSGGGDGGGGKKTYIITSEDGTAPTDANLFSALRSLEMFLRKDQDDRTEHSLGVGKDLTVGGSQAVGGNQTVGGSQTVDGDSLVKGLLSLLTGAVSPDFIAGLLGTGFELRKDEETGRWRLEIDELVTRVRAIFYELVIHKMRHVGGSIVLSPGSMSCVRVEETEDAYRCYFKATDGERSVKQEFEVGDLARSQSFNLKAIDGGGVGTSFYWRLVTAVGEDWIDLSKTHCAGGSGAPQAGDDIVQMGNLTDSSRQNATILDTTGSDAPSIKQYRGINGYVLNDDMAITIFSSKLNRIRGQFISEVTGKDVDESLRDIQVDLETVKAQSDREFTIWFFDVNPTTENLPASAWTTDAMKREHVEDIYYNREAGFAWRWMATDDGGYYWEDIKDQQTLRALEKASKAQDTADSKRRTFVAQPTDADAYDVGDQWVNVTYPVGETDESKLVYKNDALVCIQAKPAGVSFNISHWRATTENTTREIKAKLEVLEKSITSSVGSDNAARDKAIEMAQKAAEEALGAAQNADGKAGTAITQTQNYISAMSAYFEYDKDGNVVSVKSGGLLLTSDFVGLYSEAVNKDTNVVKKAEISAMVTKDANGNLDSSVKINADNINLEGYTTINGGFKVKDNGDVELNNAVVNGYVMEKPHRFANRIGKFYLNPDKGSVFIAKLLNGKTSDYAYYKLPSAASCSGRFITVVPLAFEKITSGNTMAYVIEMEYSHRYVITADGFGVAYNQNEGGQTAVYIGGDNCSKMKLDPLRGIYRFFSDGTSWYELGGHYDNLKTSSDELSGTFEDPID